MSKYVNIYTISISILLLYIVWYNLPMNERAREYAQIQQDRSEIYTAKNKLWQTCFSKNTQRTYYSGSKDFEHDQLQAYQCFQKNNSISGSNEPVRVPSKPIQSSAIREANAQEETNNQLPIIDYENQFYCENRLKTTAVELHYTAENYSWKDNIQTLNAIKTSHQKRFWSSWIGYHYVITKDGNIYSTRPSNCRAVADAGFEKQLFSNENTEHIHIAFVGDDKPNNAQDKSMRNLIQKLLDKYSLSPLAITSHAENAQKNYKENISYWYGSKESFTKNFTEWIFPQATVAIDGKVNDYATYAWRTYEDKDFILTIMAESGWNLQAYWDKDNPEPWAYSYGLCQLNSKWQPQKFKEYKSAQYSVTAIDYCYSYYKMWKDDGVLPNMLHWYNVRQSISDRVTFY